jgi:hypothetical protein
MTATRPNLSQLSASTAVNCDKFEGVLATRPNLSQLSASTAVNCDKFEGVVGR